MFICSGFFPSHFHHVILVVSNYFYQCCMIFCNSVICMYMFLWFINVLSGSNICKAVNKHRENTISLGSGFGTVIHVIAINLK